MNMFILIRGTLALAAAGLVTVAGTATLSASGTESGWKAAWITGRERHGTA